MSHILEDIPSGHPIQSSLQAIYARRGLPPSAVAGLAGQLDRATLRAAPDSPQLPLAGPLFLVHGSAVWTGDGMRIMAVVSWSDQGLPRMLAGQLDDGISAGLSVTLPGEAPAAATRARPAPAAVPAPPETVAADLPPWEAEPEPAPRNAPRPSAPKRRAEPESPHVDLSAEMAALTPNPASTPAPAPTKPAGGGSWAAAVAASSKPVSGSARRGATRQPPTASDLGFDVDGDPDLRRGDVLLHPRFGRCKVIKGMDDKVKVRRPSGAFIDLHLKVCTFTRLPDEDGKRVFDVRIGRK